MFILEEKPENISATDGKGIVTDFMEDAIAMYHLQMSLGLVFN